LFNYRFVPLRFHRARHLRRSQTEAERALWERLRAGRLNGLRFRRQFPIGAFIADFCCRECRLVIELDGGQHAEQEAGARDKRRTQEIERHGYRVARFWDTEVLTNIEGVLEAILAAAMGTSPSPSPWTRRGDKESKGATGAELLVK